jgi:hypothetical protein
MFFKMLCTLLPRSLLFLKKKEKQVERGKISISQIKRRNYIFISFFSLFYLSLEN